MVRGSSNGKQSIWIYREMWTFSAWIHNTLITIIIVIVLNDFIEKRNYEEKKKKHQRNKWLFAIYVFACNIQ